MKNKKTGENMLADLHIHSIHSDGTNTPGELVAIAKANGIKTIALTDHDTVDGLDDFLKETEKNGIRGIPGVEISTSVDGVRIHVLGYMPDRRNQKLNDFFSRISMARTENTRAILQANIRRGTITYSWEEVQRHFPSKKWLCSSHVYEAMLKDGLYKDWSQWIPFYYDYFSKKSGVYIDIDGFTSREAIEVIREAGGIAVVAHPKLIWNDSKLVELLDEGIQGIEAYYPEHTEKDTDNYLSFARKHQLLITGGTDWHGMVTMNQVTIGDCGINDSELNLLLGKFKEIDNPL
ncbi:MAG: PHP domain-containing protein [Clostridia bacterium]|nr:PHP domain-containing protein [Clostridia bacterium]